MCEILTLDRLINSNAFVFPVSGPSNRDHEIGDVDHEPEDLSSRTRPLAVGGRQLLHSLSGRC